MSAVAKSPKCKTAKEEGGEEVNGQVALFISKVWTIVGEPDTNHLISWSESGKTFVVHKEAAFAKEVLPRFFKHSNFTSFVRQLNLYGFRKVAKPDHGGLISIREDSVEFWHTNFRKGHSELLTLVQRRVSHHADNKKPVSKSDDKNHPDVSQLMSDIHQMKEKQETIGTVLDDLKDENYYLKKEIQALKVKHGLQHKVLNKIIHFVIQLVYKGKMPMPMLRNHLMLADSDDPGGLLPPAKRSRTSNFDTYNVIQNSPMLYNVTSPDIPSIKSVPSSPMTLLNESQSLESGQAVQTLPVVSYDDSYPTQALVSGDEFLANLLDSSSAPVTTTAAVVQSQTTPQSQAESFSFQQPDTTDPSILSILQSQVTSPEKLQLSPQATSPDKPYPTPRIQNLLETQAQSQSELYSLQNNVQQSSLGAVNQQQCVSGPSSQTTDVVPYNNARMSSVASHLDSHQMELDSLPDVLFDQLEIDPQILNGLLSNEYTGQSIPEYDIVDTARLLESFMDPEKDVCHESTVQIPATLSGLSTLALPSGDPSSNVIQPEKYLQTFVDNTNTSASSLNVKK